MSDLKHRVAALERTKPDPDVDPAGFKQINDEITKIIDQERLYKAALKRNVV